MVYTQTTSREVLVNALQDEYGKTFNNINFLRVTGEGMFFEADWHSESYFLKMSFVEKCSILECNIYKVEACQNKLGKEYFEI